MFVWAITNWKLVLVGVLAFLCMTLAGVAAYERQKVTTEINARKAKEVEIVSLKGEIIAKNATIALMQKNIEEIKKSSARIKMIAQKESVINAQIQKTKVEPDAKKRSAEHAKNHSSIVDFFNSGVLPESIPNNSGLSSDKLSTPGKASSGSQ